jgi:hypothetical protein
MTFHVKKRVYQPWSAFYALFFASWTQVESFRNVYLNPTVFRFQDTQMTWRHHHSYMWEPGCWSIEDVYAEAVYSYAGYQIHGAIQGRFN